MQIYNHIFVATCPALSLENGEVEYHPESVNGEYQTGTFAVFRCNDEYMRTGSLVSICQDSGTWEPDIPTCDEGIAMYIIILDIKILDCYSISYLHFQKNISNFMSKEQTQIMLNCFPAVTCSAITLENGEVTYTTTQVNGAYPLDTEATFSCSSQAKLSGSSSLTCQAFENSGNWNPQIPTCNLSNGK